jgi:hypothetical protein
MIPIFLNDNCHLVEEVDVDLLEAVDGAELVELVMHLGPI